MAFQENVDTTIAALKELKTAYKAACTRGHERLKGELENKASSLMGITLGHLFEVRAAGAQLKKERTISLQTHADLTVGAGNEWFAKSIQLKSSTGITPNDVDTHIGKAAYQLSGKKGEVPRDLDRRIVDVQICNPENPWPFTSEEKRDDNLSAFLDKAKARILRYVGGKKTSHGGDKPPKKKLKGNPAERGGLPEGAQKELSLVEKASDVSRKTPNPKQGIGERSTVLTLTVAKKKHLLDCITVKIRFFPPREVVMDDGSKRQLKLAVFYVYRTEQELACKPQALAFQGPKKLEPKTYLF